MVDYNGTLPTKVNPASKGSGNTSNVLSGAKPTSNSSESKVPKNGDDVFSDSDEEETKGTKTREAATNYKYMEPHQVSEATTDHVGMLAHAADRLSLQHEEHTENNASESSTTDKLHSTHADPNTTNMESVGSSEFKAIAADASVFSFGDEDFESD
jgi:phosphatidylinositol-3,4,5-trisphosphate 3-phosphatase/dual-specificity protein phosphatase PTEN